MAKIIPYDASKLFVETSRQQALDYKRAEDHSTENGQLDLFTPIDVDLPTLPLALNAFELALKLDQSNNPLAARYYLTAVERNENKSHALCNLGVLAAHKEDMVSAIDYFSQALVLDPRHVESHFNLANVYFSCHDFTLAILHYDIVTRISPSFPDAYFNLALAYIEIEKFKAAHAHLLTYQSLSPEITDRVLALIQSVANLVQ